MASIFQQSQIFKIYGVKNMLMIVRLYPKTDLSRVWNYIENEIKEDPSKPYTPLYASQSEGMMNVGVIIDVKKPNDIASFLTEDIVKCDEIHYTKTVPLLKPVFFRIPKKKPETIQRYVIRIYAHPKNYKKIYDYLIDRNYPFNLFPIYISYSLGDEDIIMSIAADSENTVKRRIRSTRDPINRIHVICFNIEVTIHLFRSSSFYGGAFELSLSFGHIETWPHTMLRTKC